MIDPKQASQPNQDHTAGEDLEKTEGALSDAECDKVSGGGSGPYADYDF